MTPERDQQRRRHPTQQSIAHMRPVLSRDQRLIRAKCIHEQAAEFLMQPEHALALLQILKPPREEPELHRPLYHEVGCYQTDGYLVRGCPSQTDGDDWVCRCPRRGTLAEFLFVRQALRLDSIQDNPLGSPRGEAPDLIISGHTCRIHVAILDGHTVERHAHTLDCDPITIGIEIKSRLAWMNTGETIRQVNKYRALFPMVPAWHWLVLVVEPLDRLTEERVLARFRHSGIACCGIKYLFPDYRDAWAGV